MEFLIGHVIKGSSSLVMSLKGVPHWSLEDLRVYVLYFSVTFRLPKSTDDSV